MNIDQIEVRIKKITEEISTVKSLRHEIIPETKEFIKIIQQQYNELNEFISEFEGLVKKFEGVAKKLEIATFSKNMNQERDDLADIISNLQIGVNNLEQAIIKQNNF